MSISEELVKISQRYQGGPEYELMFSYKPLVNFSTL